MTHKGSVGISMVLNRKPKREPRHNCKKCIHYSSNIGYCKNFKFKILDIGISKNCKACEFKVTPSKVRNKQKLNKKPKPTTVKLTFADKDMCNQCKENNNGWCKRYKANRPNALSKCKKRK